MAATSDTKAFLEVETGERIPCLFNPSELALTRSNSWNAGGRPGRAVPTLAFGGSRNGELRLELFFDTTDTGEAVTSHTGKLVALMDVDSSLKGSDENSGNVRPPTVIFHWGDLHSFRSVVADLAVRFTYFSATGVPLRARVNLLLRQYEPSQAFGPQNPTSGTPRPHRVHRVAPGETLDRIAARYYGDSNAWRDIASANGIEDPLAVRAGTLLSVPRRVT
ncbi:MAG: CIS tube protein [Motilibacteraceae bacterium]